MALHAARMFHESPPARAALLIDGDNISADHAAQLLTTVPSAAVARVYADPPHQKAWAAHPAFELRRVDQGKNAADMLLAIDAMELALAGGVTRFTLASSDDDYRPLALRLRALGCTVTGCGMPTTKVGFRDACTRFQLLSPAPRRTQEAEPCLDQKIRALIKAGSTGASGISVAQLGAQMFQRHGLRARDLSERSWPAYLTARPALYTITNPGPDAIVRYHPEAFRALAAN
ncbi:MAG: NYN domain-containing protein [Vannielia sp.]|uniref:NYN domain-containing protein n=1 Tax=Vannielia sp. TaxID=2813045 RepID=UPI003B8D8B45